MLPRYAVGELYHPDRTSWQECGVYQWRGGAHELILFLESPTPREVEQVRQGPSEFALFCSQPVLICCYRFGSMPWSDSPYTIHLVPAAERLAPSDLPTPLSRDLLHVILVAAETGIIRALRAVTFSPEFTAILRQQIRAQAAQPWGPARYDAGLADLYRRYPTTERFVAAALCRCRGGEDE
jgi:hypothetical protein